MVTSPTIGGDLVWSPGSSGVYYRDGVTLRFVSRTGGQPQTIATLPDGQHRLWAVDATDRTLYLTRFVAASRRHVLFAIPTRGGARRDLVSNALVMSHVQLDPSGTWILYQEAPAGPFMQREFVRVDLQGSNSTSLGKPPVTSNIGPGYFVDNGNTVVFQFVSQTSNGFHIGRLSVSKTTIEPLTELGMQRNSAFVAPGGSPWIAMQAQHAGGVGPAVMPVSGGGVIPLAADGKSYSFQGLPSIDRAGTRLVFASRVSSSTQVFMVSLDRELQVSPRAQVNRSFRVDMPVGASEVGALLISVPPVQALQVIPALRYGLVLNAAALFVLPSSRAGNFLRSPIAIPNNPWFAGQELLFQGVRLNPSSGRGDFTRHARVVIFS